jgi:O-acetyl-ADP-ribose deacetylase (regulator of RNase III)
MIVTLSDKIKALKIEIAELKREQMEVVFDAIITAAYHEGMWNGGIDRDFQWHKLEEV